MYNFDRPSTHKYPIFIQFITLITILFLVLSANSRAAENEITILNWSEYLLPDMVKAFEKKYKAKVKEVYFESDDARDRILLETNGKGFDLLLVNGAPFNSYRRQGWLQPINSKSIPNLRHIDKHWLNIFEPAIGYSVPYFWGTLGVAYRKDLISKPITSWKQIFTPSKELQGKVLMVKSSRDLIGMGLKSLGYSSNSENLKELAEVEKLLMKHKPHVARFGYITLEKNSSLVTGEIVAATVYGGDALNVAEHNKNIVYVVPEEGGNIWVDYFALSSSSKNKPLAMKFLNFINQPEWAAKNAQEMYLATANKSAKKYLPKEHLNDPIIYPSEKLLKKSEFHSELSPKINRLRSRVFLNYTK